MDDEQSGGGEQKLVRRDPIEEGRKREEDEKSLKQLENEQRRDEAVLPSESMVKVAPAVGYGIRIKKYERDEMGVPVIMDDEEAMKGGLSGLNMRAINSNLAFVRAANRVVAEQTGQIPGVDIDRSDREDEVGFLRRMWEEVFPGEEVPYDLDPTDPNFQIERDLLINRLDEAVEALRNRIDEIENEGMREVAKKVFKSWQGKPLEARLYKDKKGAQRVSFDGVEGGLSLPMNIFSQYCLGGKWIRGQNGSGDYINFGGFAIDETTTIGELREHLGKFVLDGEKKEINWSNKRSEKRGRQATKEGRNGRRSEEGKKPRQEGLVADLDKLGFYSEDNLERKSVAQALGLMEMHLSEPSFEVKVSRNGSPLVKVSNDGSFVVARVGDLMKVLGIRQEGGTWRLDGLAVKTGDHNDQWSKFFDKIMAVGWQRRRRDRAREKVS